MQVIESLGCWSWLRPGRGGSVPVSAHLRFRIRMQVSGGSVPVSAQLKFKIRVSV